MVRCGVSRAADTVRATSRTIARSRDIRTVAVIKGGMIRIVKHVIVETTEERDRQVEMVEAAIRSRFPDATTEVVQGLLDEDRVVEARLPLHQLAEWRAQRPRLLSEAPATGSGTEEFTDLDRQE
ncbi:hypothetical protein GCM10007886_01100 [Methylobacterium gregans]|nr:hypothetical protein GCM10007886_01100 [Methylobacterium gregans]